MVKVQIRIWFTEGPDHDPVCHPGSGFIFIANFYHQIMTKKNQIAVFNRQDPDPSFLLLDPNTDPVNLNPDPQPGA